MMRWLMGAALLLVALASAAVELPPRWQSWLYVRPIELEPVEEPRLVKATLPLAVYGNAWTDLRDLRVIDDTGAEVAYVLASRHGKKTRAWLDAKLGEVSFVPGRYTQALVDTGAGLRAHNQLELDVEDGDFIARVEVAASDNGRQWRVLRQRAPLYRFHEQGLPGNQQVSYPESSARWLRLRIAGEREQPQERFPLKGVRVAHEVVEDPELAPLSAKFVFRPHAPAGQSWWEVDLGSGQVPVSQVRFTVKQEEFHRPVEVLASEDSQNWLRAGAGDVHRYARPRGGQTPESLQVEFPEKRGRYWRVVVRDRNDPPLRGVDVALWGVPRHVVFRQEPRRSYRLLYGNQRAGAPQYELARLLRRTGDRTEVEEASTGALGAEEKNLAWTDPRPWSEQHPVLLWVVLAFVVVTLAVLAVRSLHHTS